MSNSFSVLLGDIGYRLEVMPRRVMCRFKGHDWIDISSWAAAPVAIRGLCGRCGHTIPAPPIRTLTLAEYRDHLAATDAPTSEQMAAFAVYVATSHSWYKHLPTLLPGVPGVFYLDPGAAMDPVADENFRVRLVERQEHGFHYAMLPTAEYRSRFGHATYADAPLIVDTNRGEWVALPFEVIEAGTAYISGLIHPRIAGWTRWQQLPRNYKKPAHVNWPEESGGAAAYAQILARLDELGAGAPKVRIDPDAPESVDTDPLFREAAECDLVLHRLLVPERQRQLDGIVAALERVADLVNATQPS